MNSETINILFCGTGGQGVLKAAEVCGWAAIYAGYHAKKSEVHGMAQRGGSVESHVRFGKQVFSPLVPMGKAHFLVPFHSGEEQRLRAFLSKDGTNLHDYMVKAHNSGINRLFINTYLLGTLAAHLNIPQDCWLKALAREFKTKNLEENEQIFLKGWNEVKA